MDFAVWVAALVVLGAGGWLIRHLLYPAVDFSEHDLADFTTRWTAPPELGRTPRRLRVESRGFLMLFANLGLALFVGWKLVDLVSDTNARLALEARLKVEGIRTEAEILDARRSGRAFEIRYEFRVGDRILRRWSSAVPQSSLRGLRQGQLMSVTYLPQPPNESRMSIEEPALSSSQVAALVIGASVLSLSTVVALAVLLMRHRRLVKYGRPLPALVMFVRQSRSQRTVDYEFLDAAGHRSKGRGVSRDPADIGDVITVMADADASHSRSIVYPSPFFRVAEDVPAAASEFASPFR